MTIILAPFGRLLVGIAYLLSTMQLPSLLSAVFLQNRFTFSPNTDTTCRCIPSQPCWPSINEWEILNASTNGQLIKTMPIGHVCHDPTYNASLCDLVKQNWADPDWRTGIPESIFATSFVNDTCDPMSPREDPCNVGGYAQYTINATHPSDVSAGLSFAKKHNVRVVVKNTGHDYLGRSVGYGSLSLWTHNVKNMEVFDKYAGHSYSGPAVRVGAGVQVLEAYQLVDRHGYMMVGGECGSVGIAGGFTAGGGQSPLSSFAGLAADQTLEYEVILADGRLVRASADEHPDLYWALSGGGPGYGVVWSVTFKIFRDVPVTGTTLSFRSGNNSGTYKKAIETWHSLVPGITDLGGYSYTSLTSKQFNMPLFVPNRTQSDLMELLSPFYNILEDMGIEYVSNTTTYPTFLDAWTAYFQQGAAAETPHISSHLLSRRVFVESLNEVTDVMLSIADDGGTLVQMAIGASRSVAGYPHNSVNPGWRDASMFVLAVSGDPGSTESDSDLEVTDVWGGRLRSLSPDSGTYVNEADLYEPDFQTAFYGENYGRLLSIKNLYDPEFIFYAAVAVGSEEWATKSDGRLCRA